MCFDQHHGCTTLVYGVSLTDSHPTFLHFPRLHTASPSTVGFQTSLAATAYTPEELKTKFATLKKAFPADANPVAAGGWYNLQKLSGNPKVELVNMVVDGLKENKRSKTEFAVNDEKVEALSTLLYGMGKGFEADLVDGDWALVFSKQGQKSPKFQKLVGKGEKAGYSLNVFDIKSMTFSGDVTVLKKCKVDSKVKVGRSCVYIVIVDVCDVEWLFHRLLFFPSFFLLPF
jgi:hypothetical protein